jgi:FtsP/CotA-like multicopper oxidase with cupredoxin domain
MWPTETPEIPEHMRPSHRGRSRQITVMAQTVFRGSALSRLRTRVLQSMLPLGLIVSGPGPRVLEPVLPNDDLRGGGSLRNGVLSITLEARPGSWKPNGDSRAVEVAAFAEEGKPLSAPGPVIRAAIGTEVRASIRNRLDKPLIVYGFARSRGANDSVVVAPNAVRTIRFTPSRAGSFYYFARRANYPMGGRGMEDGQLNGMIIIDAPEARQAHDGGFVAEHRLAIPKNADDEIRASTGVR